MRVENHGSLALIYGETPEEREWLLDTAPDAAMFCGDALVVEPRYVDGVLLAWMESGE
jgi:hypothetical protein